MFKARSFITIACVLLAICAMSNCYAQVNSIACVREATNTHCVNTGTLTFKGSNFKIITDKTINLSENPLITLTNVKSNANSLSGTISYDTNKVSDGPYTINPHLKQDDPSAWSGTIVLGLIFYSSSWVWSEDYFQVIPTDAYVTGQSTDTIYDGLVFTIYGKFNTNKEYIVKMYTEIYTKDTVPTCTIISTNATAITCTFGDVTTIDWQWRFFVGEKVDQKLLTMKNMLPNLISKPAPTTPEPEPQSLPVINNANGTCVRSSYACVDDANITLHGVRITANAEDNYLVNIENTDNGFCDVYNTTTTSISCTLRNINGINGAYTMTAQIREEDNTLSEKVIAGTLVLGGGKDVGGWSVNYVPSSGNNASNPKKMEKSATVTTVLTIVFAIFFGVTVIVMLIIFIRFKLITHKTWSAVKKQLHETQVEELRPRAAVHVKGEQANN